MRTSGYNPYSDPRIKKVKEKLDMNDKELLGDICRDLMTHKIMFIDENSGKTIIYDNESGENEVINDKDE